MTSVKMSMSLIYKEMLTVLLTNEKDKYPLKQSMIALKRDNSYHILELKTTSSKNPSNGTSKCIRIIGRKKLFIYQNILFVG